MENCATSSSSVDVESLRAALSVMSEWELDFDFLFPASDECPPLSEPPGEATHSQCPRKVYTTRSNRNGDEASRAPPYNGRNRPKHEILALREHAERLQRQLDARRAQETSGQDQELLGLEGVWEDISRRQLMLRQLGEAENGALREELEEHIHIARQLLSISTRALKALSVVARPIHAAENFHMEYLPPVQHLALVEELYSQISSVFSRPAYTSGGKDFQSIEVTNDGANGTLVVFEVSLLLPFDVAAVADALFQHTVQMTSRERLYEFKHMLRPDEASLVSQFVGLSTGSGVHGTMRGQIATRKLVASPESAFVVSKIHADVLKTDFVPFSMLGEGWLRCVQVREGLTQVQWFRRFRTQPLDLARSPVWSDLHGVIATGVKRSLDWNLQVVENLLLSQGRRKFDTFVHGAPACLPLS